MRLSIKATTHKNCAEKGALPTCITSKTKLNETRPIKVIYTAIKSINLFHNFLQMT